MGRDATSHRRFEPEKPGGRACDPLRQIGELRAEVAKLAEAGAEPLTDTLAHWLTMHYVSAARRAAKEAGGAGLDLKTLRDLCIDVVALRKGDHSAARLEIERERVGIEREMTKARMEAQFEEWLKDPEVRRRIGGSALSEAERARRIRQIFGLAEKPQKGLSPETLADGESPMIRPNPTESDP